MMHYVYIIYSPSANRYYIDETENVEARLELHNNGTFKGSYTKQAQDWQLKATIQCENRADARKVEAFIKRMKSRKFIQKLIADKSLRNDIAQKATE